MSLFDVRLSSYYFLLDARSAPASFIILTYLHSVEGRAGVEPADLLLVECVVQDNGVAAAVRVLQHSGQRLEK